MNKEESEQFIESVFSEYTNAKINGNDFVETALSPIQNGVKRAVQGRVAYDLLQNFENGKNPLKENVSREDSLNGITIPFENIPNSIWIPESYKEFTAKYNKGINVFSTDQINAFEWKNLSKKDSNLVMKVLRCKGESGENLGDKFDLLSKNSSWRDSAKKYSIFLLKQINSNYKTLEGVKHEFYKDSPEAKKGFKAIELITDLYLSEMK